MGTKLKLILGVGACGLLMFATSCAINRKTKLDGYLPKENYMKLYKTAIICGCIREGTNKSLDEFLDRNNDPGWFTEVEWLSIPVYEEADSIGKAYSKKIVPIDYIEVEGKSPVFSRCIWYGMSKEVDKIARKKYKEFIKGLGKWKFIYEE